MKFAVVVAALCGVAAANSLERRAKPSATPAPSMEPITCGEKNNRNQICDNINQVPVDNDNYKCCQWSGKCGYDSNGVLIEKCLARKCCKVDHHHVPGDDDDDDDDHHHPKPTPKPLITCGHAQSELVFECEDIGQVVNFHKKCCHDEDDGKCDSDEVCDHAFCCIIDEPPTLPELVMNCTTKLAIEEEEHDHISFECDADYGQPMVVREDGFLCCRWSPYEVVNGEVVVAHQECVDMGAHTKCKESSCCVPQDLVCNDENSPKCVAGDRDIRYGLPCSRWSDDNGNGKCNTYTHCCPN